MATRLPELAGTLHITIEQGGTFDPVLTWKDEVGTPINLTGWTAKMQIRETVESDTVIHEASTTNSQIVLGGVAGTITFAIPASVTAALSFDEAVYDLELTNGAYVKRLLKGDVNLSLEVTK